MQALKLLAIAFTKVFGRVCQSIHKSIHNHIHRNIDSNSPAFRLNVIGVSFDYLRLDRVSPGIGFEDVSTMFRTRAKFKDHISEIC